MTGSQEKILVATATYNERQSLPALLESLQQILPRADVLVIDDNSPDGTGQWVDQRAKVNARLHCIHRPAKMGLGTATVEALEYAVQHDYSIIVTLDADGSHDPEYLPAMLRRLCRADDSAPDVVIGSRYIAGGGTEGWPLSRRWMSRGVNLIARVLLGLPVRDCSGAFRAMRVPLIQRVDLSRVRSRGYSFFEEILWHFKRAGARFEEVPIVFVNRKFGQSKINMAEAVRSLAMLFWLGLRNWFTR